jgi:hypothetical protein
VTDDVSNGAPSRPYPSRPDPSSPDGEEGSSSRGGSHVSSETPKPPLYPDHCAAHAFVAVPGKCGDCADARKANKAAAETLPDYRLRIVPPLCGECDERWIETPDGLAKCPRCYPTTPSIKADFNSVTKDGRVKASMRRASGELSKGDRVIAYDPYEQLAYPAVVAEVNKDTGRVLLDMDWTGSVFRNALSELRCELPRGKPEHPVSAPNADPPECPDCGYRYNPRGRDKVRDMAESEPPAIPSRDELRAALMRALMQWSVIPHTHWGYIADALLTLPALVQLAEGAAAASRARELANSDDYRNFAPNIHRQILQALDGDRP